MAGVTMIWPHYFLLLSVRSLIHVLCIAMQLSAVSATEFSECIPH